MALSDFKKGADSNSNPEAGQAAWLQPPRASSRRGERAVTIMRFGAND